jgi:hypothetical protein
VATLNTHAAPGHRLCRLVELREGETVVNADAYALGTAYREECLELRAEVAETEQMFSDLLQRHGLWPEDRSGIDATEMAAYAIAALSISAQRWRAIKADADIVHVCNLTGDLRATALHLSRVRAGVRTPDEYADALIREQQLQQSALSTREGGP